LLLCFPPPRSGTAGWEEAGTRLPGFAAALGYIQLTEAEAAFRIHKSDLGLRPIWHQKEERVLAHILVCFLAYVLWKTLTQRCQRAGLGHQPRRVFEDLSKIQLVDVVLPTRQGTEIRRRCVTQPSDHQAILLTHLRLNLPVTRLTEGV
jgi:hypothetical protein